MVRSLKVHVESPLLLEGRALFQSKGMGVVFDVGSLELGAVSGSLRPEGATILAERDCGGPSKSFVEVLCSLLLS
jgi:hypothetical protein